MSCMIYYIKNVTNARCREMLGRLELLVFTDYQLVYKFVDHCGEDIERLRCGRTGSAGDTLQVQLLDTFDTPVTPTAH